MKKITLFYLTNCPYCKKAISYLQELQKEEKYANIDVEMIEEEEHKEIAETYDYYYVPCFYIEGLKVHEGAASSDEVKAVLDKAL